MQSMNSWIGHSSHCNSYKLQQKTLNECDFLWNNRAFEHIEKNLDIDIQNFYQNT